MALACLAAMSASAVAAPPSDAIGSGSIAGTIKTASSVPVPYGRVCVETATPQALLECITAEASGEYKFAGLVAGEYLIFFAGQVCPSVNECSQPYVSEYYEHATTVATAKPVTVPMAETAVTEIDSQLREGGKITGEVRAKAGTELEGADVCAEIETTESRSGFSYAGCTHAGAHGHYTLEGLASGDYRVELNGEVCTPGCHQEYT